MSAQEEAANWRRAAADAYRQACHQDPAFSPHAELVFEQQGELGRGGMGVVYRVKDRRLGRQAALKIMLEPSPDLIARFRREAEITARLDHPGIPPLYEAGTTPEGQHYMLMRVVEGLTLEDAIKEAHDVESPLTREGAVGDLLKALVRVSEAVAYAHSQGVIHRDLKPENVLLGSFGEVLVMDWGLARDLSVPDFEFDGMDTLPPEQASSSNPGLTQVGSVLGSPGYMPPEQASGEEAGVRADVFALGAILVAILTGRPPVEGATAINRLTQTVQGKFALPRSRRPDAPAELEALAKAVLQLDPADRLPSAQAFLDNLRAYLGDEEPEVYAYSLQERTLRTARRRSGLLLAGTLTAGLLALAGVLGAGLSAAEAKRVTAEANSVKAKADQDAEARARLEEAERRRQAEERARRAKSGLESERAQNEEIRALQRGMDLLAEAEHMVTSGLPPEEIRGQIEKALATGEARFLAWQAAQLFLRSGNPARARALLEANVERYPPAYRERFALHRLDLEVIKRRAFSGEIPVGERLQHVFAQLRTDPLTELCLLAERRDEDNAFTRYGASVMFGARGDLDLALRTVESALELRPGFPEAWIWKGAILLKLKRPAEAVTAVRRAAALTPSDLTAWGLLAMMANERKDNEALLVAIDALIANSPPDYAFLHDRAVALSALGRHGSAIESVTRALALAPENPELLLLEVQIYLVAGNNRETVDAFRRIRDREDCKGRVELWYWGSRAELNVKEYAAAKVSATQAIELGKDLAAKQRAEALLLLARALYKLDEDERALVLFNEAAELTPDDEYPRYYMARIHHIAKRWLKAIAEYTLAAKLAPQKALTLTYRGSCHWYAGNLDQARADFSQALVLNPKDHEAMGFRGRLELYAGNPQGALVHLVQARKLRPNKRLYMLWEGAALLLTGKKAEALTDLEKATPYYTKRVEAYLWRGRARAANGQLQGARADFEQALTFKPKPEERVQLEAELSKLSPNGTPRGE